MNEFFQPHGLLIDGFLHLSPKEVLELVSKGAAIVDVREEREMNGKQFAFGNVVSIPFSALPFEYHRLSIPGIPDDSGQRVNLRRRNPSDL